jgi:hypothetical protein
MVGERDEDRIPRRNMKRDVMRGVHMVTGSMEWLESQPPEMEGACEWKFPFDTVHLSAMASAKIAHCINLHQLS